MNARVLLVAFLLLTGCDEQPPSAGFAGLGQGSENFAAVVPGKVFSFPADHGAHPDFRIEWWYVTANLSDAEGHQYGVQWTLFRSALRPGADQPDWSNGNLWLGHAGLTSETRQFSAQTQGRGGIGQAGVTGRALFRPWIDDWRLSGDLNGRAEVRAQGPGFAYRLNLAATGPLVLQGEGGVSRKSASGQASYYYSQPFFQAQGELEIEGRRVPVKGLAWLDREWSSQHLAATSSAGLVSLHLDDGRQLMLYRLRQADGQHYLFGNLIGADGHNQPLHPGDIRLAPESTHRVAGREVPVRWSITLPGQQLDLHIAAVNPDAWMALGTPYWEGPVRVEGSAKGVGYLEMTGY